MSAILSATQLGGVDTATTVGQLVVVVGPVDSRDVTTVRPRGALPGIACQRVHHVDGLVVLNQPGVPAGDPGAVCADDVAADIDQPVQPVVDRLGVLQVLAEGMLRNATSS
jgi:hypothetical protein